MGAILTITIGISSFLLPDQCFGLTGIPNILVKFVMGSTSATCRPGTLPVYLKVRLNLCYLVEAYTIIHIREILFKGWIF